MNSELTLWLQSYFATLRWQGVNFLQTFTWHVLSFQCLLFVTDFFFGTHVFRVEN